MSVTINEKQLTALCRVNRSYAVVNITLTEHPHESRNWVVVDATFKSGVSRFVLNDNGGLVKDESHTPNTEHISV